MTRWIQEYEQHPFNETWKSLKASSNEATIDDETVTTTVQEMARLRKAIAFIDHVLGSLDQELTPKSIWGNCQSQALACLQQINNYNSNRNPSHLIQANEHIDNVLTYVRPYMVSPKEALDSYKQASKSFTLTISDHLDSFHKKASNLLLELSRTLDSAKSSNSSISEIEQKVQQLNLYLFEGIEGESSAEQNIQDLTVDIESKHQKITKLHDELLAGPEALSIKVSTSHKVIAEIQQELNILLDGSKSKTAELQTFYGRIFGSDQPDDTEGKTSGLKVEIDTRLKQLEAQEKDHEKKHATILENIASLLPSATSAGLASSYKALKDRFETPILNYTKIFYGSMAALVALSLIFVIDSIAWPLQITLIKASGWEEILRTMLTRLPIVLPIVWLAVFSATRRSQYERLQQEYAHKEAFASSYESYKTQLKELKTDTDILQQELLAKAIEAISFNASKTLDGNHTEKPPIMQALEKFSTDDIKKIIDAIKNR